MYYLRQACQLSVHIVNETLMVNFRGKGIDYYSFSNKFVEG